ncbi:MAG: hypothetical protein HQM03_00780 [Magnetococcales bacterium]|nr:hypothetical protein [Magnetococcales bacterium]
MQRILHPYYRREEIEMGHLQIRNVDDEVIEQLWLQAEARGVPVDIHIREVLTAAAWGNADFDSAQPVTTAEVALHEG